MTTRVLTCDQDYRRELADALAAFDTRVRSVPAVAWTAASPCDGWTAADVVSHVTGNVYAFAAAVGSQARPPQARDDPPRDWAQAKAVADQIISTGGDPTATVPMMLGERAMTFAFVMEALLRDVVIHTWDLARATGGDEELPAHLVTAATAALARLPGKVRQLGLYAAALPSTPEASGQERLLALAGRPA